MRNASIVGAGVPKNQTKLRNKNRHMIHLQRLRLDLQALATESRALKRDLRSPWERPMADEQRRLVRLRRQTTERLVLLASARGRLHVRAIPTLFAGTAGTDDVRVWHARVAERVGKDYGELPPNHPSAPEPPDATLHEEAR